MFQTSLHRSRKWHLSLTAILAGFFHRSGLRRARRRLAELDDHMLRDIGVNRAEALAEANRKGWDAPDHWHH